MIEWLAEKEFSLHLITGIKVALGREPPRRGFRYLSPWCRSSSSGLGHVLRSEKTYNDLTGEIVQFGVHAKNLSNKRGPVW